MKKRIIIGIITAIIFCFHFPLVEANYKAVIDIEEITIKEIQTAYDNGYLSAKLLVNLYLDRINTYNQQYGAIINVNEDAIKQAQELDNERRTKGPRSLLHGIPIVIKDNIDFVSLPTTGGAKALNDSYPVKNAFIIQKLIDAGAIILAKTNMSNFAFSGSSSISSFYTTKNAYNLKYSSYGSSGGTAVAVAANLATIGLGTDTNSSIRGPAAVNNLVGLRPTMGLVSRTGILPYTLERDISGPITRTVTDLAILLDYISGYDKNDKVTSKSINKIPNTYTKYLKEDGLNGVKVGIIKDFITSNPNSNIPVLKYSSPEVEKLMENAIKEMEALGAEIIYIENFYTNKLNALYNSSLDGYMFCHDLNQYLSNLDPNNRIKNFQDLLNDSRYVYSISGYGSYCSNNIRTGSKYEKLLNNKKKYEEYVKTKMNEYDIDVFAYPTIKTKPVTIANSTSIVNATTSHTIAPTIGWPSINVPLGFDRDGLPYGLQFTSEPFTEGNLIAMAYAYEQKTNHRKPPSIAPNLYKVPTEITLLLQEVKKVNKLNLKEYTKESVNNLNSNLDKVKNYISNYNDSTEDPNMLLTNLNNKVNQLEKNKTMKLYNLINNKHFLYLLSGFIVFRLLKKIARKKKQKKRKKHKKSRF